MNLYEAKKKKKYKVTTIDSGFKARNRLGELGIFKGVIIEKIESILHGPLKIKVKDTIYALGKGICKKIMVEEIEDS